MLLLILASSPFPLLKLGLGTETFEAFEPSSKNATGLVIIVLNELLIPISFLFSFSLHALGTSNNNNNKNNNKSSKNKNKNNNKNSNKTNNKYA